MGKDSPDSSLQIRIPLLAKLQAEILLHIGRCPVLHLAAQVKNPQVLSALIACGDFIEIADMPLVLYDSVVQTEPESDKLCGKKRIQQHPSDHHGNQPDIDMDQKDTGNQKGHQT